MKDFAYLEQLPFTAEQKKRVVEQGHRRALDLICAIDSDPANFERWLRPYHIDSVRTMLWNLTTADERAYLEILRKRREEKFRGNAFTLVIGLIFFVFLFMSYFGCAR
jgi:hypothetical protein